VQQAQAGGLSVQRATNLVLRAAIDKLEATAPADAQLLRRRFIDETPVYQLVQELSLAEATIYSRQRRAIDALTALLAELERQARSEPIARAEARLPWLESQQVFGLEPLLARLLPLLTDPEQPHIVMLTGMGGVGKTTAARHALERIVHSGDTPQEVGWISAQQRSFHPSGDIRPVDAPALTADDLLVALAMQLLPAEARSAHP
jgi:flagellar biosynthesis GTPase FlhF